MKRIVPTLSRHGVMLLASTVVLLPLLFTLMTSLKIQRDVYSGALVFPPTLRNYASLFTGSQGLFDRLILNSLIAGLSNTVLVLAVASLAAYGLTRFQWRPLWSGLILGWLLFIYMLPPITFVGPFYVTARSLGLYDNPLTLGFAHMVLTLPFAVWLMQSFMREIPRELEEAAAIDGCSRAGAFWRIILPIARPGLLATGILAFIFSWKDFLFALVLTSTPQGNTVPIGIAGFVQEYSLNYGQLSAAAILATIPAVVLVMLAQRHIVKGMTMGAVKG